VASNAFICGLAGTELSNDESAFLRDARPWGVILFKRNVVDGPEQVRRLCDNVRETLGRQDVPILIDQEGGRVQRVGPPHLRAYPAGAVYGQIYRKNSLAGVEAAFLGAKLIALDLQALGISVNCMPVLDIPIEGGTPAIGNRGLGDTVDIVATLGGAQLDGVFSGGLLPVIKHMPGHGRAMVDSHSELPHVDATVAELEAQDFTPFRLIAKRAPLGMTAHVVYLDVDDSAPATLSRVVIDRVIRQRIGFDGALMTDDLSMKALSGTAGTRAAKAIEGGCDLVLHCNGDLAEMIDVAAAVPELAGDALRRTDAALALRRAPGDVDRKALESRFDFLLNQAVAA
jgi:beta-N-acetylhexosaminidase